MDCVLMCANLQIVELIDSMLVVDPGLRFTIEQCLAHPWLTQAAPEKGKFAKPAPVLRRKPTMLGSDQVAPSSIHIVSSKELKGPEPEHLPPNPVISTTETKAEGKISSVDLDRVKHLIVHGRLMCIEVL